MRIIVNHECVVLTIGRGQADKRRLLQAGVSGEANTAATIAPSTLQDTAKAAAVPEGGGPTFQMDREAQQHTAQPVPASANYTESADGTLKLSAQGSSKFCPFTRALETVSAHAKQRA